jgi:hypothetical protein
MGHLYAWGQVRFAVRSSGPHRFVISCPHSVPWRARLPTHGLAIPQPIRKRYSVTLAFIRRLLRVLLFVGGFRKNFPNWNVAEHTTMLRPAGLISSVQSGNHLSIAMY